MGGIFDEVCHHSAPSRSDERVFMSLFEVSRSMMAVTESGFLGLAGHFIMPKSLRSYNLSTSIIKPQRPQEDFYSIS